MPTPLNYDCACCQAAAALPSAVDATLIILCMCTYDVCTIDSIVKDLTLREPARPPMLLVMPPVVFDPEQRAHEKQASREEDARALESGEVSREDLARANGAFAFPRGRVRILAYL